jgi:hypothetical protein
VKSYTLSPSHARIRHGTTTFLSPRLTDQTPPSSPCPASASRHTAALDENLVVGRTSRLAQQGAAGRPVQWTTPVGRNQPNNRFNPFFYQNSFIHLNILEIHLNFQNS